MIKIKVYAPGFLTLDQLNKDGTVTIADGTTLDDLFHLLNISEPFRLSLFCTLNDEKVAWESKLNDGDTVSFMYPMPGG
ncbi:MAG: MoaD/ThiS family protein [Anaerolineaceae bacterium]